MNPVTEAIAPGYFAVIHKPMDFKTMQKKLKGGEYHSLKGLQVRLYTSKRSHIGQKSLPTF